MFRSLAPFLVLFLALLSGPASSTVQKSFGLRATQTVVGVTSPSTTLSAEHVPLNFGAGPMASNTVERRAVADTRPIGVTVRDYGFNTMTRAEIVQTAKVIMSPDTARVVGASIKQVMAQGRVGSGVFLYDQEVRPKGSPRNMKLLWSVTVTDTGRVIAGDPRVVDADPTLIYMIYTSMAADDLLPATWKWPDAGFLQWQLRKADGTPLTDWVRIDTRGAFDERSEDTNFMIRCLANKDRAGCPSAFPDASTLIDDTASAAAIIDYIRKLSPALDLAPNSNADDPTYLPRMTISYDVREYALTQCNAGNYRNAGRRGYELETTIDRYQLAESDLEPILVNSFSGTSISPTDNFDVSKSISATGISLSSRVLDSFNPTELVNLSDVVGLQYAAPVKLTSTLTDNLTVQGTQSDMSTSWVGNGRGEHSLYFGTSAVNSWSGDVAHDRTLSFNIVNKDFFSRFSLAMAAFDDWLLVNVNGANVYIGPAGGDRLDVAQQCVRVRRGWFGRRTVCTNYVQHCAGCLSGFELGVKRQVTPNINLLPYLRSGSNTIFMRTMVGGTGEAAIRADATSCVPSQQ